MTLRRIIGRALHAMATTSSPQGWEDDPGTITTAQALDRLGVKPTQVTADGLVQRLYRVETERDALKETLKAQRAEGGDPMQLLLLQASVATLRDKLAEQTRRGDDALTSLAAASDELERVLEALDAETRQRSYAEQSLARVTRDVALRTTQRDKARSERDRLQAQLDEMARAAQGSPPC